MCVIYEYIVCDETDSKSKNSISSTLLDSHAARKDCFSVFIAS